MKITVVEIGEHTFRFANDTAPGEPDAWKYKIDEGLWSPPFESRHAMLLAACDDATRMRVTP